MAATEFQQETGHPPFKTGITYDGFGRQNLLVYPQPSGVNSPFVVRSDYDSNGYLIALSDNSSNIPYWQLGGVDAGGRLAKEKFGHSGGVVSKRSYDAHKGTLKTVFTNVAVSSDPFAKPLQNLKYEFDDRLNLESREDTSQAITEAFTYDPLDRLKCAYFKAGGGPGVCHTDVHYAPNGNITWNWAWGTTPTATIPVTRRSRDTLSRRRAAPGSRTSTMPWEIRGSDRGWRSSTHHSTCPSRWIPVRRI